jgi:enamine deaminase RidA (YjgF/YER057c/UK114 family)
MKRQLVSSGSPYEKPIGFSRAVRVGNVISVAGTGPIAPNGTTACPGDAYGQAHRCLVIIKEAIEAAGARLDDVVRTRLMLTDVSNWKEVARAHGEFFADIRPASTLVEISRLVQPDWLVEIEADCVIADEN